MTILLDDLIDREFKIRQQLEDRIMCIIMTYYEIGKGCTRACEIQQMTFNTLGFFGNKSYPFCKYINKLMTEKGFRVGIRNGYNTFYGVIKKQPCQIQLASVSSSEMTTILNIASPQLDNS